MKLGAADGGVEGRMCGRMGEWENGRIGRR